MPSNIERKARRIAQTRLTFEPVSSSPAPTMSPARVRYEPVGKRITPASSLQLGTNDEDENSETQVLGSAARKNGALKVDTASGGRKKNIAKTLFKTVPTPAKSSQHGRDNSAGMYFFLESSRLFFLCSKPLPRCTITCTSY